MIRGILALCVLLRANASFQLVTDPTGFPAIKCQKYACGSLESDQCTKELEDVVEVAECPGKSHIDHTFCSAGSCEPLSAKYGPKESYAGELCSASVPCVDSTCVNGRCFGKSLGQSCDRHTECNPGLFCGFFCRPQLPAGRVGCRDDWDCANGSGCNYGQCLPYFSLSSGDSVELCDSFENRLCDSGLCRENRCIDPIASINSDFPTQCSDHSDCAGFDQLGNSYYTQCVCGFNEAGSSYCKPFPGDEVASDYIDLLKIWAESQLIDRCNTARRWEMHCMVSNWKKCRVEEYLYKSYRFADFAKIVENPECVSKSLTRDYWDLREVFRQEAQKSIECVFAHEYGTFLLTDSDS